MLAYYGTKLSEHIVEKPDGSIICTDAPIARTGEMEYLACELGLDGDPERVVKVVREAEDVFDAAALASFEGAYVTDGHPPRLLTAETAAPYVRGHVEHIRRSGRQVIGDLHIFDPALASDIRSGRKRELSCGYDCTWLPLPDGRYRQKNIRGNHVAVVPKGRAGRDVAIQDAAAQAGKGTYMNEFGKAILTALGLAAKDAQPEELDGLVQTAGAALDANPSAQPEPPAGEGPPAGAEPPAADAALEKILERLDALERKTGQEEKPESKPEAEPENKPEDKAAPLSPEAKDAAAAIIKAIRPAVAGIQDPAVRTQVSDSLLSVLEEPDKLAQITAAVQDHAGAAARGPAAGSFEQLCREAEAAYAARNPHKMKKEA